MKSFLSIPCHSLSMGGDRRAFFYAIDICHDHRVRGKKLVNHDSMFYICLRVGRSFVCQRRKAKIFGNTVIGRTIVHGIDNTIFLFKLSKNVNATLDCPDRNQETHMVETSVAFTIPLQCTFSSEVFEIPATKMHPTLKENVTFEMIPDHPSLKLLDRPERPDTRINLTEFENSKQRLEKMDKLTKDFADENDELDKTIVSLEEKMRNSWIGGVSLCAILLIIAAISACCLCRYARSINQLAGPTKIKCCPC